MITYQNKQNFVYLEIPTKDNSTDIQTKIKETCEEYLKKNNIYYTINIVETIIVNNNLILGCTVAR